MDRDFWSPRPERVAVFRALQLGDMLCAIPALRALRAFLPRARITLIGLPWAASFVERYSHLVDDFLAFPGYPGNPESEAPLEAMLDSLREAQSRRFDVAIQLHGSGETSNRLVRLMGAQRVTGFGPSPPFLRWPTAQPEIHRYLSLMAFLGVPLQGTHLEMPLSESDILEGEAIANENGLRAGGYVVVHPGARLRSRRWPVERFAEVAARLAHEGWPVVVTGSAAERDLTGLVVEAVPGAIDLTGATSLGSLAVLLQRSALLVCNDTGVVHVASAVGARSAIVASGSDVARWAPLDATRQPVLWHDRPCRPCAHEACPTQHECARGVSVDSVLATARRLLPERFAHAA